MVTLPAAAQHIHLQLSYAPATQWRLFIYDFDSGEFDPADTPFHVGHQAFSFVPTNAFTNFLGPAGATLWTLPEAEAPELIYLGLGTSGIAPGTFVNNQIHLQLRSLDGPGHFALYNVDPFGGPVVHMNSRDGIDPAADFIALSAIGGHVHVNWAFSGPGLYRVGFSAAGRLAATGQTRTSSVVEYTFIVQDIPWRPRLDVMPASAPGVASLRLRTDPGRSCRIESSADLARWSTLTNFTAINAVTPVIAPALDIHRYFRALVLPP